jgi:molecular chaperone HscC
LSESELKASLNRLEKFKFHPREEEENRTLIATAEKLYTFASGELREQISNNIKWFEGVLETQDRKKVAEANKDFARFLAEVQEALNVFE